MRARENNTEERKTATRKARARGKRWGERRVIRVIWEEGVGIRIPLPSSRADVQKQRAERADCNQKWRGGRRGRWRKQWNAIANCNEV